MKLNLGCGQNKFDGYVNIDVDPGVKPDLVHDFAQKILPYEDNSIEAVACIHTIEHVPRGFHSLVFGEINRVLQSDGTLYLAYPNAEKTLQFALENHRGMRESYWEHAILGRHLSVWDGHRALIFTTDLICFLREFGFGKIRSGPEVDQEHNTFLEARKVFCVVERSQLLRKEVVNATA